MWCFSDRNEKNRRAQDELEEINKELNLYKRARQ